MVVGPLVAGAFAVLYPPTAQIGGVGWVVFGIFACACVVLGALILGGFIVVSWTQIYLCSFAGIAQVALLEWLAGGGGAPYPQLLLLPVLGAATDRSVRDCALVVLAALAAALSPALYSHIVLASMLGEFLLLALMALVAAGVLSSVRDHRARLRDHGEYAALLARVDPLTGLPNRRSFDEALVHAIGEARQTRRPLALVICDVDSFKYINDRFGHLAGDACLRAVASALRGAARRQDTTFRWAGDEFAVIMPHSDALSAEHAAARLAAAVSQSCASPDGTQLNLSVGVGMLREATTAEELIGEADLALFARKPRRETQSDPVRLNRRVSGPSGVAA
jgi:diguanylate cyclase (GGDEF)-like protein